MVPSELRVTSVMTEANLKIRRVCHGMEGGKSALEFA
jgi:hypothetical protein